MNVSTLPAAPVSARPMTAVPARSGEYLRLIETFAGTALLALAGEASTDWPEGFVAPVALTAMAALALVALWKRLRRWTAPLLQHHFWPRWIVRAQAAVRDQREGLPTEDALPSPVTGPTAAPTVFFTQRELEILRLVAQGERDKDIARTLCIEEATVRYHLNRTFGKLGARSRAHVVWLACEAGLLP
ncbi:MAG: response regulator transcription factor [Chloroflexi bacterium]|nr:response regulator transcription factor [Chloroflexota bacterium]